MAETDFEAQMAELSEENHRLQLLVRTLRSASGISLSSRVTRSGEFLKSGEVPKAMSLATTSGDFS